MTNSTVGHGTPNKVQRRAAGWRSERARIGLEITIRPEVG